MKKIIAIVTVLLFILIIPAELMARPIVSAKIPGKPVINTEAAICIDADTGQVYFAKNADRRMYPASTTKMMTAILALENGDLNAVATVSENAGYTDEGQDVGLSPGDRIRLGDLVKAALLHSANDSTVAIGEQVGGTEKRFISMMNNKAIAIGAYNTRYANTNGYNDPNHYTTARDLARIARYGIYNIPRFRELVNTKEDSISWQSKSGAEKKHNLYNTNRLLHQNKWIHGVKTGTTPLAGNCLVSYGRKDGRNIITVVLNSGNRYGDTMAMFDYAFKAYRKIQVVSKGETVGSAPVEKGVAPGIDIKATGSFAVTIPAGDIALLKRTVIYKEKLVAPVNKGEKVGILEVAYRGRKIYDCDVVAAGTLMKKSLMDRLFHN